MPNFEYNIPDEISRFCQVLTRVLFDDFSDSFQFFVESHATCKIYVIHERWNFDLSVNIYLPKFWWLQMPLLLEICPESQSLEETFQDKWIDV